MAMSIARIYIALLLVGSSFQVWADAPLPVGTWYSPAGEYAGICMTFTQDGKLKFFGGFTFYNPSQWRVNKAHSELSIVLGGKAPFPLKSSQYQIEMRPTGIVRINPKLRELVFPLSETTRVIDFGGFNFNQGACKD